MENLKMSKKATEDMIKEIWQAKASRDAQSKRHMTSLADFLHEFLRERHGAQATTVGYNLLYCCHKFKYDPDCELFLQVRRGVSDSGQAISLRAGDSRHAGCCRSSTGGSARTSTRNSTKSLRPSFTSCSCSI